MAKAPTSSDWTAIRLAQMREAGQRFGDFPEGDANGKRIPQMDAAYTRELLKYWYAASAEAYARVKGTKSGGTVTRLASAVDAFRAEMEPFAATVLIEGAALGQTFMLSREACLRFFDAVGRLAFALKGAAVAPTKGDLWLQSLDAVKEDIKELASDAGKALKRGAEWVLIAGALVAVVVLGGRNRRG